MAVKLASHVPTGASNAGVADAVRSAIGDGLIGISEHVGEISVAVTREALVAAMTSLRDTPGLEYQQLMEIAGVDYPSREERFEVVYCLLSLTLNRRIKVKVRASESTPVPTIVSLWPVAGWLEREVYDMYGVAFSGNPDLRRILTDYGFEGFPQRKDFPLTGHVELRYSEREKRVIYEPVELPQDFRSFDFLMPWQGPEYRLPGDEKAEGEAAGAPSPAKASGEPPEVPSKTKVDTPKTTESPADTGAGPGAEKEAKKAARKPTSKKDDSSGGKATEVEDPAPKKKDKRRPTGGAA